MKFLGTLGIELCLSPIGFSGSEEYEFQTRLSNLWIKVLNVVG